jgi:NTE family protein
VPYPQQNNRVGLILGGGGARGFAHIGVLKALETHDIYPSALVGTSMGAIIGAFYAAGISPDKIIAITETTPWKKILDISLGAGVMEGDALHEMLANYLPARFDQLALPFAVTTTDIERGEQITLAEGDLIRAVRASSCFPGAFEPIHWDGGRVLVDGGVLNNLPVNAIEFADTSFTIASDASAPRTATYEQPDRAWWQQLKAMIIPSKRATLVQTTARAINIMQGTLLELYYQQHPADILIRHEMPDVHVEDFQLFAEASEQGEAKALEVLAAAKASNNE